LSIAVGVDGANGPAVEIFDSALNGIATSYSLPAAATSLTFAQLDKDNFSDLAVTAGSEVDIIHGSPDGLDGSSRIEHIPLSFAARAVTVGEFTWDRDDRYEMAVLATDGSVHVLQAGEIGRAHV